MKQKYLLFILLTSAMFGCNSSNQSQSSIVNTISEESSLETSLISTSISDEIESSNLTQEEKPAQQEMYVKPITIYLNPSVQVNNKYYDLVTTEAQIMQKVANRMYDKLKLDKRFSVYMNDGSLSLKESVSKINSMKIDYHLALHTNAGGGSGSEAFYKGDSTFASKALSSFNATHSFKTRGVKDGSHLYELKNSKAKNKCLMEFLFHDNANEGYYLKTNYNKIADSMVAFFESLLPQA